MLPKMEITAEEGGAVAGEPELAVVFIGTSEFDVMLTRASQSSGPVMNPQFVLYRHIVSLQLHSLVDFMNGQWEYRYQEGCAQ